MRLIDADIVKENIAEWLDCVGNVVIGKGLSYTAELDGCIDDAPTIDPEELRPKGRWIDNVDENGILRNAWRKCSACGGINYKMKPNYCPNCGAKMEDGHA